MSVIIVPIEDTFDQWRLKFNDLSTKFGDFDDISILAHTPQYTNIIDVISDNFTNIGDLSTLTTTYNSDLVGAINEVDGDININTAKIGDLSTLTTTYNSDLVGAINEVDSHCDSNITNIGVLGSLTTTDKTNLVNAINEVDSHCDSNTADIGDMSQLNTTATTLVGAINESIDDAIAMAIALG